MFMFLFEQLMVVQRQTIFKYHIETLKSPDPRDMAFSLLPRMFLNSFVLGLFTPLCSDTILSANTTYAHN